MVTSDCQADATGCAGDWDVVIHLNMSGPSTSLADIKGGLAVWISKPQRGREGVEVSLFEALSPTGRMVLRTEGAVRVS